MLYRTHHLPHPFPLLFSSLSSSLPQVPQAGRGMECVQGALKSSFRPEILLKTTTISHHHHHHTLQPPVSIDDLHLPADDFSVDDLLDFNGDGFEDASQEQPTPDDAKPPPISSTPPTPTTTTTPNFSAKDVPLSFPLCETADDEMAELEWVSQYVDDTSGYSLTAKIPENLKPTIKHSPPAPPTSYTAPVQTKARSKRTRTGGRVWSLGSTPLTESSTTSSSSSSSCTSNPWLVFGDSSQTAESLFGKPPVAVGKKPRKKKPAGDAGGQQPRRCSHCLVQKTPQWRTGPLGAKTLCNACGVRYKSGRLLPEYRPACSPTFSSEVHSNNHRKVLEMRRKKEAVGGCELPVQRY